MPEPVWQRLQAELPADPNARVFPSRKGGFLPLGEYRWAFDHACDDVGIEGLVPHGVRHTTASLAISAGANVKVVQRLLGHATAAMTLDRAAISSTTLIGGADALVRRTTVLRYHCRYGETKAKRHELASELQSPHSPIGRGSGLKIRTVSVRVRLGAPERSCSEA